MTKDEAIAKYLDTAADDLPDLSELKEHQPYRNRMLAFAIGGAGLCLLGGLLLGWIIVDDPRLEDPVSFALVIMGTVLLLVGGVFAVLCARLRRHPALACYAPSRSQLALDIAAFKRRQTASSPAGQPSMTAPSATGEPHMAHTPVAPAGLEERPAATQALTLVTCGACGTRVFPMGDGCCPQCRASLDQPKRHASHEQPTHLRVFVERDDATMHLGRIPWCVMLDDRPVGELINGGVLAVPLSTESGPHKITVDWKFRPANVAPLTVPLGAIEHPGVLITCRGRKGAFGYDIVITGRKLLSPDEVRGMPASVADASSSYQAPAWTGPRFSFSQALWQKTAILFALYWLARWLFPSILPELLLELDFRATLVPCVILGLAWTGLSFVLRRPGTSQRLPREHV